MSKRYLKKAGRRWFDGKNITEVKQKLIEAYSNALPMAEVRLYAGVGKSSLSRYLASNPAFRDRLELLRKSPNILARNIIANALKNGDLATAKWWLEHKDEEFKRQSSTKITQMGLSKTEDLEVDKFEIVIVETEEQMAKVLSEKRNADNEQKLLTGGE